MKFIYKFFIFYCFITILLSPIVLADDLSPVEDDFNVNEFMHDSNLQTNSANDFPTINSRAYIILDRKSSTVILGKNHNQRKKMASTTKIMTSLVVIENCNLSDTVEISKKAGSTGGSRLGIKTGDKITVNDLLYGLMLCSGNDAAVALAEHVAGSINNFSELMNNKALELGLTNTHFITPHGLDADEHYTTAYELAILSNYALKNETFAKIVGTKEYTITINNNVKTIRNTNELLGNLNGVYGIKTGFTNGANRCLVTACKRGDMDIICVVLGADTKKFRSTDSIKLMEYAFSHFEYVDINNIINTYFENWKKEHLDTFSVYKGLYDYISLTYNPPTYSNIPIKNDMLDKFNIIINCNTNLNAPISKGTIIGNITLLSGETTIYSSNISVDCDIKKKNITDYLILFYSNFRNLLVYK
ncbi:MAG: D-alanyl-D-alanine carboxypeptidase family protein [Clostridia bacterium]